MDITEEEIIEILNRYGEHLNLKLIDIHIKQDIAKSIIDKIKENENNSLNYAISEGLKESMKANGELVKRHIKQLRSNK